MAEQRGAVPRDDRECQHQAEGEPPTATDPSATRGPIPPPCRVDAARRDLRGGEAIATRGARIRGAGRDTVHETVPGRSGWKRGEVEAGGRGLDKFARRAERTGVADGTSRFRPEKPGFSVQWRERGHPPGEGGGRFRRERPGRNTRTAGREQDEFEETDREGDRKTRSHHPRSTTEASVSTTAVSESEYSPAML